MWRERVDRSDGRLKEKRSSAFVRAETTMETAKPAPAARLASLTRTVTKIFRLRRAATVSGIVSGEIDSQKLKPYFSEYQSASINSINGRSKGKPELEETGSSSSGGCGSSRNDPDMDSLLANIFAGVSAIKAAYAQLQVAESPYDPDIIQASDHSIVSELTRLSRLKQSYLKKQQFPESMSPENPQLLPPQLQEQQNLLRTYEITARKLESSRRHMDTEIKFLQTQLSDSAQLNRSLESRLRRVRHLSLDDMHQSLPDPKRFISVLRAAVKSIRNFVKQLVREMESAGWDIGAAAGAIQPVVRGRSDHWTHAFESFVCRIIFSDFHQPEFGIERLSVDRRRFYHDFLELSSANLAEAGGADLEKFIRTKYHSLVHPKMEASFFKSHGSEQFLALFALMAKKVWLLHCLYFSYGPEVETGIFQVKGGCRFSEVYMESVTASPANSPANFPAISPAGLTVAFTVVPGFRVGKTMIQCQVYASSQSISLVLQITSSIHPMCLFCV